ncbi:hypothetical protein AQUCO_00300801v1 [Aquilegia coerulea]|uniref:MORF/ORRM1/DAG-like MORF domain-containing protein n=1 Tax=Aquilegia coerulea TaxID=218851 RepID=A0A2G5F0K8_AQUCA|nr:hypothetical protein AQUCO_00300801v1 [Aquilegia coerulea]
MASVISRFLRRSSSSFQIRLTSSIPASSSSCCLLQKISSPFSRFVSTRSSNFFTPRHRVSCIMNYAHMGKSKPMMKDESTDKNHWIVQLSFSPDVDTYQDLYYLYIRILASIVGSDEEARKLIYLVSSDTYYGFGAEIDARTCEQLRNLKAVLSVWEDAYYNARNMNFKGYREDDEDRIPRR